MEGEAKVKVKLTLEQATKTQTGSRVTALHFNLGAGWECVVNATPKPIHTLEILGIRCTSG
jgi:hypothetical protein